MTEDSQKPLFPELQDKSIEEYRVAAESALARAAKADNYERVLKNILLGGTIVIAIMLVAFITLWLRIQWASSKLGNLNSGIQTADNTLYGLRMRMWDAQFVPTNRGHFMYFPPGTTFDTNWTCKTPAGEKRACVQVIPPPP